MAIYRILVPAGIGDFSWLWSKLSTTGDSYIVSYANASPDRLSPYLALLPKSKILGFGMSPRHRCRFNVRDLEMSFDPADSHRIGMYSQMHSHALNHVEPNTHLERGGRIEAWLPDIPKTDLHYKIEGLLPVPKRQNFFIVHFSSTHTFRVWKHYDVSAWIPIIDMVQRKTGWTPVFIGGGYDDFAEMVFEQYVQNHSAVSLIGRTPDLLSTLCLIQQCKFFLGTVSSGLTMLANVLYTPLSAWWPREKLPQSWADENVPYQWLMWKDPAQDVVELERFIQEKVLHV